MNVDLSILRSSPWTRAAGLLAGLLALAFSGPAHAQYGSRGSVPAPEAYGRTYPDVMDDYARAGVVGGIPEGTFVKARVSPGANLQAAIDSGGPGVVELLPGTYPLHSPIYLKEGVILRGAGSQQVVLSVRMTSTSKQFAIQFGSAVSYAGLEDLTVSYDAIAQEPIDRAGLQDGSWYAAAFENNPHGRSDLYVGAVGMWGNNNWLDGVDILKSGTDPILVQGNHNTIRGTLVDRAYNKGDNGNGYFDLRGDANLIVDSTVKRIRHFAIQQGADHNVILDNHIEGDVNFHNGDGGYNLLEDNTVLKPSWHGWTLFGTGGASYGHAPPGPNNRIYKNETWDYKQNYSPASHPSTIYSFGGYGEPYATSWPTPAGSTFYAVKSIPAPWSAGDIGGDGRRGFVHELNDQWTLQAGGNDIGGAADDFTYVWQPLHGDGEIVAQIVAQQETHEWAKAGLMIRESLQEGARHAQVSLTPTNGARFEYRQTTGGDSTGLSFGGASAPQWLRLTRIGNTLASYVSPVPDGDWTLVGSTDVPMWEEAYIGFFASSHDPAMHSQVEVAGVDVSPLISLEKDEFAPDEPIAVRFGNGPANPLDWIGIYAAGDDPAEDASLASIYVARQTRWTPIARGRVVFAAGAQPVWPLPPGDYYAGFFADDTHAELADRVYFSVVSPLAGDFSGDGVVDGADLLAWQRGQSPAPGSLADLEAWKANFGTSVGAAALLGKVPEPSGWALVAAAGGGLTIRRRCFQKRERPPLVSSFQGDRMH